jgi:5-methylcytosine-specific restriction endonuclease McrA
MDPFATSHFSHDALLHDLKTLDGQHRRTTAVLLSRVAEAEDRRLFLREGYPSMHAYCIHELHWCEGTASRRIYAARAARRFPVLFDAVADGRLHLTAVLMLSRYLTSGNVDALLAAATHRSKAEIQELIAERFPQPDLPEVLQALGPPPPPAPTMAGPQSGQPSPENADAAVPSNHPPTPEPPRQHSPENVESRAPRPELKPLAPQRFGLQVTIDRETHELLRRAQALMSHQVPAGDIATVLKSALQLLVDHLEKRKFAATDRPRASQPGTSARHIPAAVKREVRERDEGQCTFVSDSGKRCPARSMLEFDHADPVACGGLTTAENLRLRCRAHNQYAAECTFGAAFMDRKRAEARGSATARSRESAAPVMPRPS